MYSIYLSINQRRRHLPEILTVFWKGTQTDRPTDRHFGLQGSYTSKNAVFNLSFVLSILNCAFRFLFLLTKLNWTISALWETDRCFYLCIYLSLSIYVHLYIFLSIYVYIYIYLSIYLSMYLFNYLTIYVNIPIYPCIFIYLSIYLSMSAYLYIYNIYLSIYL